MVAEEDLGAILRALVARQDQLKAEFSWVAALASDNPELSQLLNLAVSEFWTPERFEARLKNTTWYKSTSENARKLQIVERTDPQTYKKLYDEKVQYVRSLLGAVGATMTDAEVAYTAKSALMEGTSDQVLAGRVKNWINFTTGAGSLFGRAGEAEDRLRGFAAANGVAVSDDWILAQAREAAAAADGDKSVMDKAMDWINQQAVSAFPALAEQLRARRPDGSWLTVEDVATNYKQTMAKVLELDPNQVTLQDATLRKALQGDPANNTQPGMVPLWKFERDLRQDDRWQFTKTAKQEVDALATTVLTDFGFLPGGR